MKYKVKTFDVFLREKKENECKPKAGEKVGFVLDDKDKETKIGYIKEYLLDGNVRVIDLKGKEHDIACDLIEKLECGVNENDSFLADFSDDSTVDEFTENPIPIEKIEEFLNAVYGGYDSYEVVADGIVVLLDDDQDSAPSFYSNEDIKGYFQEIGEGLDGQEEEELEVTPDGIKFDEPVGFEKEEDMDFYFYQLVKKYNVSSVSRGGIGSKFEFPIEAKDELDTIGINWYQVDKVTNPEHPEYGKKYIDVTYKLPMKYMDLITKK